MKEISVAAYAEREHLSVERVRQICREGKLPARRGGLDGRKWWILVADPGLALAVESRQSASNVAPHRQELCQFGRRLRDWITCPFPDALLGDHSGQPPSIAWRAPEGLMGSSAAEDGADGAGSGAPMTPAATLCIPSSASTWEATWSRGP